MGLVETIGGLTATSKTVSSLPGFDAQVVDSKSLVYQTPRNSLNTQSEQDQGLVEEREDDFHISATSLEQILEQQSSSSTAATLALSTSPEIAEEEGEEEEVDCDTNGEEYLDGILFRRPRLSHSNSFSSSSISSCTTTTTFSLKRQVRSAADTRPLSPLQNKNNTRRSRSHPSLPSSHHKIKSAKMLAAQQHRKHNHHSSSVYFQTDFLANAEEAHRITRLHRVLSKLAFWNHHHGNNNNTTTDEALPNQVYFAKTTKAPPPTTASCGSPQGLGSKNNHLSFSAKRRRDHQQQQEEEGPRTLLLTPPTSLGATRQSSSLRNLLLPSRHQSNTLSTRTSSDSCESMSSAVPLAPEGVRASLGEEGGPMTPLATDHHKNESNIITSHLLPPDNNNKNSGLEETPWTIGSVNAGNPLDTPEPIVSASVEWCDTDENDDHIVLLSAHHRLEHDKGEQDDDNKYNGDENCCHEQYNFETIWFPRVEEEESQDEQKVFHSLHKEEYDNQPLSSLKKKSRRKDRIRIVQEGNDHFYSKESDKFSVNGTTAAQQYRHFRMMEELEVLSETMNLTSTAAGTPWPDEATFSGDNEQGTGLFSNNAENMDDAGNLHFQWVDDGEGEGFVVAPSIDDPDDDDMIFLPPRPPSLAAHASKRNRTRSTLITDDNNDDSTLQNDLSVWLRVRQRWTKTVRGILRGSGSSKRSYVNDNDDEGNTPEETQAPVKKSNSRDKEDGKSQPKHVLEAPAAAVGDSHPYLAITQPDDDEKKNGNKNSSNHQGSHTKELQPDQEPKLSRTLLLDDRYNEVVAAREDGRRSSSMFPSLNQKQDQQQVQQKEKTTPSAGRRMRRSRSPSASTPLASPPKHSSNVSSSVARQTRLRSALLRLYCSRDEKGGEKLELEWPTLFDDDDGDDAGMYSADREDEILKVPSSLSQSSGEFGELDASRAVSGGCGAGRTTCPSSGVSSAPSPPRLVVEMDSHDQCAQLVIAQPPPTTFAMTDSETTAVDASAEDGGTAVPIVSLSAAPSSSCVSDVVFNKLGLNVAAYPANITSKDGNEKQDKEPARDNDGRKRTGRDPDGRYELVESTTSDKSNNPNKSSSRSTSTSHSSSGLQRLYHMSIDAGVSSRPDNETPVARARRPAVMRADRVYLGKDKRFQPNITSSRTNMTTEVYNDHKKSDHRNIPYDEPSYEEKKSDHRNIPFDEPSYEDCINSPAGQGRSPEEPGSPQPRGEQERQHGLFDMVHDRLYEPIMKCTSQDELSIEHLCGPPGDILPQELSPQTNTSLSSSASSSPLARHPPSQSDLKLSMAGSLHNDKGKNNNNGRSTSYIRPFSLYLTRFGHSPSQQ